MDEVARTLSGCRLGVHMSAEELRTVAQLGSVRAVSDGARLAGLDEIAVLLEGEAEVRHTAPGGPAWTTRARLGDVLNEQAFLGGTAALHAAVARGPARVFALSRAAYQGLVATGDPAAAKFTRAIAASVAARLDDRSAALLELLRRHEALLESMDRILANEDVRVTLFGPGRWEEAALAAASDGGVFGGFAAFKRRLLEHWDG